MTAPVPVWPDELVEDVSMAWAKVVSDQVLDAAEVSAPGFDPWDNFLDDEREMVRASMRALLDALHVAGYEPRRLVQVGWASKPEVERAYQFSVTQTKYEGDVAVFTIDGAGSDAKNTDQ